MTVKKLIKLLQEMEPNRLVVLSRDCEGNGFMPLDEISTAKYDKGELGLEELTIGMIAEGYTECDLMLGGKKAVVLWPDD